MNTFVWVPASVAYTIGTLICAWMMLRGFVEEREQSIVDHQKPGAVIGHKGTPPPIGWRWLFGSILGSSFLGLWWPLCVVILAGEWLFTKLSGWASSSLDAPAFARRITRVKVDS